MMQGVQQNSEGLLPEQFSELERFVSYWGVNGHEARRYQRYDTTMAEAQQFYDAVYPRADEAMTYLEPLGIRDLAGPDRRLAQMILSLAQVSMAVEAHKELRVPYSSWPNKLKILSDELI
jgi:hypothetical protein